MRALFLLPLSLVACNGEDPTGKEKACAQESGTICTFAGSGLAGLGDEDVPALDSHLYLPQDLTFGPDDQPYILDWNNHRIRTIDADGKIQTVVGSGLLGDGPEGPALSAALNHPTDIEFDDAGRMVIAAWHNSRIERIDLATGTLEFVAGTGARSYNGDPEGGGIPAAEAILDLPASVSYDDAGRLFIADQANQLIRMIDTDGMIYDIAGSQRVQGYAGDGGPAADALIYASIGQAADPANRIAVDGNQLYMADTGNHVIRVLDLDTLTMDTYAGKRTCDEAGTCTPAPGYADGAADDAQFYGPTDLEVGPDGEMYVADTSNSCVRVIYPDGGVETFAGVCGETGYEGDGGDPAEALLYRPYGVSLDSDGNVYIADTYNQVFRVVWR